MFTINCKGKLLSLHEPVVMGIINITPDSFYQGHIYEDIVQLAATMLADGAQVLDVGGQTTKPGSNRLGPAEELDRVLPVINAIHQKFPEAIISIDTYHSSVAKEAIAAGASIINDISAGSFDPAMIATVAALQVPYVIMHMQGTPKTMQLQPFYENAVSDVFDFFISRIADCEEAGINDIIIDPGFGFGKSKQHNFQLLKNMQVFAMLDKPVLAGLSRKGMIYRTLNSTPSAALNGTTALNMAALLQGANMLRVHDVKQAIECIFLYKEISQA